MTETGESIAKSCVKLCCCGGGGGGCGDGGWVRRSMGDGNLVGERSDG